MFVSSFNFDFAEMPTLMHEADFKHTLFVWTPDLYHGSPDSGDLQYESREMQQAICTRSEGW